MRYEDYAKEMVARLANERTSSIKNTHWLRDLHETWAWAKENFPDAEHRDLIEGILPGDYDTVFHISEYIIFVREMFDANIRTKDFRANFKDAAFAGIRTPIVVAAACFLRDNMKG